MPQPHRTPDPDADAAPVLRAEAPAPQPDAAPARPLRWYEYTAVMLVIAALLWYAARLGVFGV